MIPALDLFDVALLDEDVLKGDYVGHPFRGNQWTDASGVSRGGAGSTPDQDKQAYELRQQGKTWDEIAKILGYANGGAVRRLAMRHEQRLKDGGDKDKPKPEEKPKPESTGRPMPKSYDEAMQMAGALLHKVFKGDVEGVLKQLYADADAASLEQKGSGREMSDQEREMESNLRAIGALVDNAIQFAIGEALGEDVSGEVASSAQHALAQNAFNRFASEMKELHDKAEGLLLKATRGTKQGDVYDTKFTVGGILSLADEAIKIAQEDGIAYPDAERFGSDNFELVGQVDAESIQKLKALGFVGTSRGWIRNAAVQGSLEQEAVLVGVTANKDAVRILDMFFNDVRFGRKSAAEVLETVSNPQKLVAIVDGNGLVSARYGVDLGLESGRKARSLLSPETRSKIFVAAIQKAADSGWSDQLRLLETRTVGDLGVDVGSLDPSMKFAEVSAKMQELAKVRADRGKELRKISPSTGLTKRMEIVTEVLEGLGVVMGSDISVSFDSKATKKERVQDAFRAVSRLIPNALIKGSGPMRANFSGGGLLQIAMNMRGGRAHAVNNGGGKATIKIENPPSPASSGDDDLVARDWSSTLLHETGHGVEYANPWVRYMESLHWKTRAGDEKLKTLRSITGMNGYQSYEKGVKDDWLNYYAGKSYGGTRTSTYEIFTTGLQNIYHGDQSADADHRNLVLGILAAAGQMRGNQYVEGQTP